MRNTIYLIGILFFFAIPLKGESQEKAKNNSSSAAKDTRFMVGVKGGLTFSQPVVLQKFSVISTLDNSTAGYGIKTYKSFIQNIGYQYAFTALYQFNKSLDIRIEPNFATYTYKYETLFSWISTGTNNERIDMLLKHSQSLNYLEIPVTLRYLYGSGTARPFIQGGLFWGHLMGAIKSTSKAETYSNTLGSSTLNSGKQTGDAMTQYVKSRYGFNAGVGVDYDLSVVHITFDVNLNFGINSVANEAGRYSNQQNVSSLYDIQDNVRLIVPSVNIGILFPLRKSARSKLVCKT